MSKKSKEIKPTSKMDMNIEKYVGKHMKFVTKVGDFEGRVSGVIWMGASFIELEEPMCLFNTHNIVYGIETEEASE